MIVTDTITYISRTHRNEKIRKNPDDGRWNSLIAAGEYKVRKKITLI